MTDLQNTIKSATRLKAMYLEHPYTGINRAPERYKRRPGYYSEHHENLTQWSSTSKEARVAAELSMLFEGLIADGPLALDGERLNRPKVSDKLALKLLCQTVVWFECEPKKKKKKKKKAVITTVDIQSLRAQAKAEDILSFLKTQDYDMSTFNPTDAVAYFEIASKQTAYCVTKTLLELQQAPLRGSCLEIGLLRSLNRWTQRQAYGAILPCDLKKRRESTKYTQQRVAESLGITQRQYARYEHGETPVPDGVVTAIDNLTNAD